MPPFMAWLKRMLSPPRYHVVKKGETLSGIAWDYYGDRDLFNTIFNANRDLLDDPNKIQPGQRLLIPYLKD
jgi:nucleoid-associated protein YgaU